MPPPITWRECAGSSRLPIISSSTCRRRIRRGCAICSAEKSSTICCAGWSPRATRPRQELPLLVKIAPDLTEAERADIAALAGPSGIDGIVIANTTVARPPGLKSAAAGEQGGLSGKPLFVPSTALVADIYRLTEGKIPLIGVGGIASAEDAYAKIRAGASLVQLYTALVFQGPALIGRIKRGLAELLRRDGFANIAEAVGADHVLASRALHPISSPT